MRPCRPRPATVPALPSLGSGSPRGIILAVRWYLRFGLSFRVVEDLLAERRIEVDHVTVYRWVHRFAPVFAEAARPCRHAVGDRWHVDETYLKVAGRWRYLFRAIDQFGQFIDVFCRCGVTGGLPTASSSGPSARPRSRLLRSSPIRRRCTRRCWRSCCQRHGIAPTSTPTQLLVCGMRGRCSIGSSSASVPGWVSRRAGPGARRCAGPRRPGPAGCSRTAGRGRRWRP